MHASPAAGVRRGTPKSCGLLIRRSQVRALLGPQSARQTTQPDSNPRPDLIGHLRRNGWSATVARAAARAAKSVGRDYLAGRITQDEAIRRCRAVIGGAA
jgi:hypothetical protein